MEFSESIDMEGDHTFYAVVQCLPVQIVLVEQLAEDVAVPCFTFHNTVLGEQVQVLQVHLY